MNRRRQSAPKALQFHVERSGFDAAGTAPGSERDESGIICGVRLSALTGEGCADLRAALAERFPARVPLPNVLDLPAVRL